MHAHARVRQAERWRLILTVRLGLMLSVLAVALIPIQYYMWLYVKDKVVAQFQGYAVLFLTWNVLPLIIITFKNTEKGVLATVRAAASAC